MDHIIEGEIHMSNVFKYYFREECVQDKFKYDHVRMQ